MRPASKWQNTHVDMSMFDLWPGEFTQVHGVTRSDEPRLIIEVVNDGGGITVVVPREATVRLWDGDGNQGDIVSQPEPPEEDAGRTEEETDD